MLLLLLFLTVQNARAESVSKTLARDARRSARAAWQIVQAPFRGDARDYALAGGIVMSVAALSALDRSVRGMADSGGGRRSGTISDIGHAYQQTCLTFAVAGACYTSGLLTDTPALRRAGLEVIESFCLSALASQLLKRTLGRNRPSAGEGPFHFTGFNCRDAHQSFPSGDTVKAFSLSTVLSAEAKSLPVSVALYTLATATAFQRLHRDRHWLSDTVGGAALGTAVGWSVIHAHRRIENLPRVMVTPSPDRVGLTIRL